MIRAKTVNVPTRVVHSITYDKCGKNIEPDDWAEWQELVTISFRGGFGSIFGDGTSMRCDLCQHCLKDVLGDFLKIVEDDEAL